MSSNFPSPDEQRRAYEEFKRAIRPQRRTFSEWRQDRAEYRERLRISREKSESEARETARERQRLALAEVDGRAKSFRSAARSRRYEHRTSKELAPYVANVYRARGYTAKIQAAYDDSNYSVGQDGWITDNLDDISETDLVVWVTW